MKTAILLISTMLCTQVLAQAGALDNSFSGDGKTTFNIGGDTKASAVVIQPDGKILVAGSGGASAATGRDFVVARYLPNGNLDPTFDGDGIAIKGLPGMDEASCISLQTDGKILVGGYYTLSQSQFMAIVRLNADGSADTSFGLNGQNYVSFDSGNPTHNFATGVAIQVDGRIVVCGYTGVGSDMDLALARFDTDGSIDANFGTNGMVTADVGTVANAGNAVAIQSDGRIVVAGYNGTAGQTSCWHRFNIDGSPDPSFGNAGHLSSNLCASSDNIVTGLRLLPSGKILVGGTCGQQFAAARLQYGGGLDNTFGILQGPYAGTTTLSFPQFGGEAFALQVQADGKILLVGTFLDANAPSDLAIARLTSNGELDNTFGNGGWQHYDIEGLIDYGAGMALQSDGKIVVVGQDFSIPTKGSVIRVLNDVGIGIPEINTSIASAQVFPALVADEAELRYTLTNAAGVSITAIDLTGRTVRTFINGSSRGVGPQQETLPFRGLTSGRYQVVLTVDGFRQSLAVTKE